MVLKEIASLFFWEDMELEREKTESNWSSCLPGIKENTSESVSA